MRAASGTGDSGRACAAANGAREAGYLYASARTAVDDVMRRCSGGVDDPSRPIPSGQ